MSENFDSTRLVAVDYDPFSSPELQRVVATTESQREVWLADRLGRDASLAFNESVSLHFHGALNVPALKSSIQRLIERHEALRATISADGMDFCISPIHILAILDTDLSQFPAARKQYLKDDRRHAHVTEAFDLEQGPLIRAEIIRLGPTEHELIITAHHIVCDGWSFWVLARELASLYRLQVGAPEPALVPADSFAEFALRSGRDNQTDEYSRDEDYWLAEFAEGAPVLDLPTDRPRPPVRTFASEREDRLLEPALAAELKRVGAKHGASLFAAVMATFAALLYRLSGQTRVVIGVPAAGQSVEGRTELVGHCVNLLPVKIDIDPSASYTDHLARVTNIMMDAFEHQKYTFGTLLKRLSISRDPSRQPLVSAIINIDQALSNEVSRFPELVVTFGANARQYESFELFINAAQVDAGLRLECQYNKILFDRSTVMCWLDCFESLMRGWLADPGTPVERLPLLGNEEKLRVNAMQPAATEYPNDVTVETLVEACVEREGKRCALRFGDESWSYLQLENYANRMAHCLRARGVRRGSRVGICLDRSIEMVGSLLGVLKAGGAYVPLDPVYPVERLRFMVEDADLAVLVSEGELSAALEFPADRTLLIDADAAEIGAASASRLPRDTEAADADSIAYVIYTSGSTGKPKGVQVQHQAVVNLLCSLQREPGLSSRDRLLAVTTISFDIHVLELWLPLMSGAEVVLAGRDTLLDATALRALVESSGATCMQATPTLWRPLIEAGWMGNNAFKALSGGEPLPPDLAEQLLQRCGELWNLYGPTETTVWSTCCRVSDPRAGISIGRPIANTRVYILDEQQQLCPIGVPGEMYIGGDGVTAGYLNRAELTAERFLPDPYSNRAGARLYRTGDRGRWLANGTLEHLGRLDYQVKLRGFRIELEEVEAAIRDHAVVSQAVVVVRGDKSIEPRLVAYVTYRPGKSTTSTELRRFLRARLPDYMLPNQFVELDSLPLTDNGKLNRLALPALSDEERVADVEVIEPRTKIERDIAAVWQEMLGIGNISIRDNFFELGGHSLLAAQMVTRLTQSVGYKLKLRSVIFETLEQIAASVEAAVSVAH